MTWRRGRRLGVDVGDARIGVASCDPDGLIATPIETVPAGPAAIGRLVALADEYEALEVVVGLPLGLSGREGPAAVKVRAFAAALATALPRVSVRLIDERLSTVAGQAQLHASGRTTKSSRSVIDQAAAVVILQSAIDAEKMRGTAPGELVVTTEGNDA
ncbi:Holliday junction resolvase RuvX [Aeromicrobium tamlense]|uniref:Putative pre-16S rRNA nuclease n=1 Tax=Aeromicrobium tamlense TaxID=375541 RepID=A0A8I0FVR0_9ACTN|nr:Holliday junction resolvase RuvX [Aeromicrobium tamlense]MBD1270396.1 Holliday junction resolvase RuvX [Aeromicrobium tamlense]MBD1271472.1 Holliday junction resolvase RuvX [Aeromicrobium tamlense]NYI37783.1 putative Holliday junction resolvase [Aeromicrobium tamlense]